MERECLALDVHRDCFNELHLPARLKKKRKRNLLGFPGRVHWGRDVIAAPATPPAWQSKGVTKEAREALRPVLCTAEEAGLHHAECDCGNLFEQDWPQFCKQRD
eukprot:1147218-Pelagomonas_calceolata.AAC.1